MSKHMKAMESSVMEEWAEKCACPACGEDIVSDLLDMHLDLECTGTDEDDGDIVETIRSHLNHDVIIWSSDPKTHPPTLGYQPKDSPANLFFVQTPQKSEVAQGWDEELAEAASIIDKATAVLIVAGAGIGVDSGLPDYRSPNGFWKAYPVLEKLGLSIEDISHPDWFSKDPTFAWGFYGHRLDLYTKALPHDGFKALKAIVDAKSSNYFIFTSNIDGQFQKAGFDEEKIYECHGSLGHLQCSEGCGFDGVWELHKLDVLPSVNMKTLKAKQSTIPKCPNCKAIARPNVSMFGDTSASWNATRSERQRRKLLQWLQSAFPYTNEGKFDVIETSGEDSCPSTSLVCDNVTISAHESNNSPTTTTTRKTRTTRKSTVNTDPNSAINSNDSTSTNNNTVENNVNNVQKPTTRSSRRGSSTTASTTPANQEKEKEKENSQAGANGVHKPVAERMLTRRRERLLELETQGKHLVIIECGCGVSLHSIRIESEALLRNTHEVDKGERVKLVRLNPTDWQVPPHSNVGLGLGAKAGLLGILERLETVPNTLKSCGSESNSGSDGAKRRRRAI